MRSTEYRDLCYQHVRSVGWRFVHTDTGKPFGPIYPTKRALLEEKHLMARLMGLTVKVR